MKRKYYWIFYNDVYEFNLFVFIGKIDYIEKFIGQTLGEAEGATLNNGGDVLIWFKNKPQAEMIAHEAVHGANYIFKDKGIKLDVKNDEAQAYLTGWFAKCINKTKL